MSYLSEMEWGANWEWENFVAFGSKGSESPKKLQLMDWTRVDDGEIDTGSLHLSGGGRSSGASGSDGGNGSSVKSTISASTDSSTKNRVQNPDLRFVTLEDSSGKVSKNMEMQETEVSEVYQPLNPSCCSIEPLIGLKLGKRTYFENSGTAGYLKSSSLSVMPIPLTTTQKKMKSFAKISPTPCCQVEGCNIDLSTAKEYHRKHRVCDIHSKCPKVIVGGLERRFCQQCSRFHSLFDFDEKKRSCRNRLSDHNARRRKPQLKQIHFDSMSLSSPFFGGMQQMSSLMNNSPLVNSIISPANTTWDNTRNSKFTLMKSISPTSEGDGYNDEPLHMHPTHAISMHGNAAIGLLASKSSTSEVVSPGSRGSLISSHLDEAPEYHHRALSLLSSSSWGSCGPRSVPVLHHPMHDTDTSLTQPRMHANAVPEAVPLSSTEFWPTGWYSTHSHARSLATDSNIQEIQVSETPCESNFYSNLLS